MQELVDSLALLSDGDPAPPIKAQDWAAWLASDDAARLQEIHPEGFHDAPISVQAALCGQRRALIGGRLEFPAFHYRLWMDALAVGDDPDLVAGLNLMMAVASACDQISAKAELGAFPWQKHEGPDSVRAPSEKEYERLREALRIEPDSPEATRVLQPLKAGPQSDPWQPLIEGPGSTLFVADPWALSLAGVVRGIARAERSELFADVCGQLSNAALNVAVNAAEEMQWRVDSVEEDYLVAHADVDCLVVLGVGVIPPNPTQFGEESLSADNYLGDRYERLASISRSLGASHSLLALIGDGRAVTVGGDSPMLHADAPSDPWVIGLAELETVGEALRSDPLALPAALERIPPPPWPENIDLLDYVGFVRRFEEGALEAAKQAADGTEHMLRRARMMAARHPAPTADGSQWIEVSRWQEIENAAIFHDRKSSDLSLLVRTPGRFLWVTCLATVEQRYELVPTVSIMLAFWLGRLCRAGFLAAHAASAGETFVRFRIEMDRRPGPCLAICPEENGLRLVLGPGFVETLCRGDNTADRMLVGAVLAWAREIGDPAASTLLEEVVPEGRGTFVIWTDPDCRSMKPRLDPPPPVEPRMRQEVERGLAESRVERGAVALVPEESLAEALEDFTEALDDAIGRKVGSLDSAALRTLVALHERSAFHSSSEAVVLPARSEIGEDDDASVPSAEPENRDLIWRTLVERLAASPPSGTKQLGRRNIGWLRAAVELQMELLGALDAVRYEKAGGRLAVSPELGIRVDLGGELPAASRAMRQQLLAAAPDLMVAQHQAWWGERPELGPEPSLETPVGLEPRWKNLDLVLREEWGVGFEQLLRILRVLSDHAEREADCVACAVQPELERMLAGVTAIAPDVVAKAVKLLTLGPVEGYRTSDDPHHPGRANRARSYLRRPLVSLPDGQLAWSSLHCLRSAEYLYGLIENGRLRGSSRLVKAVTKISQALDREFEGLVLEEVSRCGWEGASRLRSLGGVRLERSPGQEIGDIDVLAWSASEQRVWLLDAKRLFPGIEPRSMLREGKAFKAHVQRHGERLQWVRNHLPELAREIGCKEIDDWEVEAALVLDRPLTGPHLRQLPMPVWTLWSLPHELAGGSRSQ